MFWLVERYLSVMAGPVTASSASSSACFSATARLQRHKLCRLIWPVAVKVQCRCLRSSRKHIRARISGWNLNFLGFLARPKTQRSAQAEGKVA